MTDWAITVPKTINWDDYSLELYAARNGAVLNYRVPRWVGVEEGDRVFVVWNGRVRGWHRALGCTYESAGWRCGTTDRIWPAGTYIQRTGEFTYVDGPEMKGFRGIRQVTFDEVPWNTTATPAAAPP